MDQGKILKERLQDDDEEEDDLQQFSASPLCVACKKLVLRSLAFLIEAFLVFPILRWNFVHSTNRSSVIV